MSSKPTHTAYIVIDAKEATAVKRRPRKDRIKTSKSTGAHLIEICT